MKVTISLVVLAVVGATIADPVRRPAFQRQTAAAAPKPESESAPYPASGWKPAGPQIQYGLSNPAEPTTTETPETTTTPPESNPAPARLQKQPKVEPVSGVYYILQEDGRLQQVVFVAEPVQAELPARLEVQPVAAAPQPRKSRVQLELQDVEPIRGPVYAYSGPLQRILRQA